MNELQSAMIANQKAKSKIGPRLDLQQQFIEKAVNDIFDDLIIEISLKRKLHPSEQFARESGMAKFSNFKIYDFINSYHAFCKLCHKHFYSRSMAGDINSFFQKHANTSYHRQLRAGDIHPEDAPIFSWEQTLRSGRCNVCNLSGLNSFVINTKFCIIQLMRHHVCVWEKEQRDTNEKFIRKLNLLKKYCGLKFFREKYIKTVNKRGVCLMCGILLPWAKKKAACHLKSDTHYQKFCMFLWVNFNFAPKDLLNGYNLEAVTRWLVTHEPPVWTEFADYNELEICVKESNSCDNPYPDETHNMSYCPNYIELLLRDDELDFIGSKGCLLCGVKLQPGHFRSVEHCAKAKNLSEKSFERGRYVMYLLNREKRLFPYSRMIESYRTMENRLKTESSSLPMKEQKPPAPKTLPQGNYFRTLFLKKLALVEDIITPIDRVETFCHVCDQYFQNPCLQKHVNGDFHKSQAEKWNELKRNFTNERFMEPFKKFKNIFVCLLCGVVVNASSFFSHLKGGTHARKLELYTSTDFGIPISSAFKFRDDYSCSCTVCDTPLRKKNTFHPLKATLKNIKCHWPCPRLKEGKKKDPASQMEVTVETKEKDFAETVRGSTSATEACEKSKKTDMDCGRVGETVENVVNVFDEAVTNKIRDNSVCLLSTLDNSNLRGVKSVDIVREKSFNDCDLCKFFNKCEFLVVTICPIPCVLFPSLSFLTAMTGSCSGPSSAKGGAEKGSENKKQGKIEGNERKKNPSGKKSKGRQKSEEGKQDDADKKHEVLFIRGLPKKKKKQDFILSRFGIFGKIQYVNIEYNSVVIAFVERGVAAKAAEGAMIVLQSKSLFVTVAERKVKDKDKGDKGDKKKTGEQILSLNKDIIKLLQEPPKLMEFVLNLIVEAVTASESPVEAKREEVVCNLIVQAALEYFPHCRCYPFGSRLSGLTLNNSDLDVFLDCGNMYDGFKNTTPTAERKLLRIVAKALRKVRELTNIIVVDSARVPIISFLHKPTLLQCDVSFKSGLSIQNTLLIKFILSIDWRVKPLILFLKHWAKLNGLHGPPYFSSYAISMLVIFYLEQLEVPILPTIESLQDSFVGHRITIGGWDCSINTNKSILPKFENTDSLPTLLAGFFEYYATFDYSKNAVSPLNGKFLPRIAFSESGKHLLPMCYKRQMINIPTPMENLMSDKIPICVIDSFDLSHILTKNFTHQGLLQFIRFCQMSGQHLRRGMTNPGSKK